MGVAFLNLKRPKEDLVPQGKDKVKSHRQTDIDFKAVRMILETQRYPSDNLIFMW